MYVCMYVCKHLFWHVTLRASLSEWPLRRFSTFFGCKPGVQPCEILYDLAQVTRWPMTPEPLSCKLRRHRMRKVSNSLLVFCANTCLIHRKNPPTPLVGAGRAMGLSKLCCYANSFARGGPFFSREMATSIH